MGMVAAAVIMYLKSNIGSFEIIHTIYYLYIHTYILETGLTQSSVRTKAKINI